MADQVIDLNKTPLQNLLSLIKYDNPDLIIDQGLIDVGSARDFVEQGNYRNTQIDVVPTGPGYTGIVTVKYARLKLHKDAEEGEIVAEVELQYPGTQGEWYNAILSSLNVVAGEALMFINGDPYNPMSNPITLPSVIEFRPVPGSLLYIDVETLISVKLEEIDANVEGDIPVAIQMFDIDLVEIG